MTIASMTVFNPNNPDVKWTHSLQTQDEYHAVKAMCLSGRSVSILHSVLFPSRTNNLPNFAQDFFFPLLCHVANKTSSYAVLLIESLVCFFIDVITWPCRLVTCIPRAIYNALQNEHSFLTYLKQNGIDKQIIATDHVRVELKAHFGKASLFQHPYSSESGELTVYFVDYPATIVPEERTSRGSWILIPRGK